MFNYSHLILKPYIVLSTSRLSDLCHEPRSLLKHSLILQVLFTNHSFLLSTTLTSTHYYVTSLHCSTHAGISRNAVAVLQVLAPPVPSRSTITCPTCRDAKKYKQHGLTNSHVPFFQISNRPRSSKISNTTNSLKLSTKPTAYRAPRTQASPGMPLKSYKSKHLLCIQD